MKIFIQSTSDVITNSSTEVYLRLTNDALSILKNAITSVLRISSPTASFDDFFDISYSSDYTRDEYLNYIYSNCPSSECRELVEAIQKFGVFDDKNIVQTTLMEKLEKISSESYEEFCYRQDEKLFTVTPKMLLDKHIKAAEALNQIGHMFYGEAEYNG